MFRNRRIIDLSLYSAFEYTWVMFAQSEVQILPTNHSYYKNLITAEDKDRLKIGQFRSMIFLVNAES